MRKGPQVTNEDPGQLRERLLRDERVQHMIRLRAYEIYRMRGHSRGGPADDWLQAEGEVLAFLMANDPPSVDSKEAGSKTSPVAPGSGESVPTRKQKPRRMSSGKTASSKAGSKRATRKPLTGDKPKRKRTRKQPNSERKV
jgi:Protein of unknown function (DUF2934)